MKLPPYGLCLPCTFLKARDGDTIEVRLKGGGHVWAVRMLECWVTDNRKSQLYQAAKAMAERFCQEASDEGTLSVFVPFSEVPENVLQWFSFDRVLGRIYLNTETTLGELLIRHAVASVRKGEEPE